MSTPRDILDIVVSHQSAVQTADPGLGTIAPAQAINIHDFLYGQDVAEIAENVQPSYHITYTLENISSWIQHLWQVDFSYVYTDTSGHTTLIKHQGHVRDIESGLNPIHSHEEELQALQYLRGMLLIAENTDFESTATEDAAKRAENFKKDIQNLFEQYLRKNAAIDLSGKNNPEKNTHWLAEQFAKSLTQHVPRFDKKGNAKKLSIKKARKQVTMAKDAAILLEKNIPSICTISETNKNVSIELSSPVKIARGAKDSDNYYLKYFTKLSGQSWFLSAKKSAGFDRKQTTWLDNFFNRNYATIKDAGVPALTSARWLPTPANNQTTQTMVLQRERILSEQEELPLLRDANFKPNVTTTSFVRMGITSAYGIKDIETQEKLATEQLKEIIRMQLQAKINEYKEKYNLPQGVPFDFFVSYQTLLSPHYVESYFYGLHNDNNARFIEMAKKAIKEVAQEYQEKTIEGATIHVLHTNSAINDKADWITAKQFSEDLSARKLKLKATAESAAQFFSTYKAPLNAAFSKISQNYPISNLNLDHTLDEIQNFLTGKTLTVPNTAGFNLLCNLLREGRLEKASKEFQGIYMNQESPTDYINQELQAEMANRLEAAVALKRLMNNDVLFKNLGTYQKNLMMAALEFHSMGSQALSLIGCKSARDRTAIFAAAVKTMQENPAAMYDWKVLNAGIIKSLRQGHHFRAMLYHSAVVKISAVHSYFMEQMPKIIQTKIKSLKKFSKTLDAYTTSVNKRVKATTANILEKIGHAKKLSPTLPVTAKQTPRELAMYLALALQKLFIIEMNRTDRGIGNLDRARQLQEALEKVGTYISNGTYNNQKTTPSFLTMAIGSEYNIKNLSEFKFEKGDDLDSKRTGQLQVDFIKAIEKLKEESADFAPASEQADVVSVKNSLSLNRKSHY